MLPVVGVVELELLTEDVLGGQLAMVVLEGATSAKVLAAGFGEVAEGVAVVFGLVADVGKEAVDASAVWRVWPAAERAGWREEGRAAARLVGDVDAD
jgi:hypothetical protein